MNHGNRNGGRTLLGDLVGISLDVVEPSIRTAQFFEPKGLRDRVGDSGHPDIYHRFAALEDGEKYGITIRLHEADKRFLCRVGIDGRNVVDGSRIPDYHDLGRSSAWTGDGYVLNVAQENGGTIEGWRESMDHVRRFVVTTEAGSYAAEQWHDLSAVGTIVIATFRERPAGITRSVGTGFGDRVESRVELTHFDGQPTAYEIIVIKYAPLEELRRLGVVVPEPPAENRIWPQGRDPKFCTFPH